MEAILDHDFLQYIALQILEKLVQTRWKAIPDTQRQGEPASPPHYSLS